MDSNLGFDAEAARADVPILSRVLPNGRPLVYLDNAATTQKPKQVISAISEYYEVSNANIHRALHTLAHEATDAYEDTRDRLTSWFNASDRDHIVFTSGATEAINLVARGWGAANLGPDDAVLLTEMEHHSNIVPWQMLQEQIGFEIRYIPVVQDAYVLDLEHLDELLKDVRLIGVVHTSNVLGTRNPVELLVKKARAIGARILIDGAQAGPHEQIDVQSLDCDFLAISAHKMCGPTGVGCLVMNNGVMDEMQPFLGGGDMIEEVWLERSTFASGSSRFEAGTPKISAVIGWGAALEWLGQWSMSLIHSHCLELARQAVSGLKDSIPEIRIFGDHSRDDTSGVVSFLHPTIHASDLATLIDMHGVAVRTGHHCAQPLMRRIGVLATSRASFYLYNTEEDVKVFLDAMTTVHERFS
ncbi:MAG: cysteine desulfurase [Euryarchaeota archaeon]|nr:cysteine desulfurase [Euryarchaeota archaeon]